MVTWETVQHQVAIAGRVADAQTGKGLAAIQVRITAAPAAYTAWLAIKALQYGQRWETLAERPDRRRTAPNGHFHWLDLPEGAYTLSTAWPEGGSRYGTAQMEVTVARDPEGNLTRVVADSGPPAYDPHRTDQQPERGVSGPGQGTDPGKWGVCLQ